MVAGYESSVKLWIRHFSRSCVWCRGFWLSFDCQFNFFVLLFIAGWRHDTSICWSILGCGKFEFSAQQQCRMWRRHCNWRGCDEHFEMQFQILFCRRWGRRDLCIWLCMLRRTKCSVYFSADFGIYILSLQLIRDSWRALGNFYECTKQCFCWNRQ